MAPEKSLTPLELEIMQVLWDHGPATVAEVQPRLKAELAYTTVMTMLGILLKKGKVKRSPAGRAFRYRAAVSRQRASGSAVQDLLTRMFGNSPEALVMSLVETRGLTGEDLARLARAVHKAEAESEAAPRRAKEPKGKDVK